MHLNLNYRGQLIVCTSSKVNESNVRKHVWHSVNVLYDVYMRFHARCVEPHILNPKYNVLN
jgi:hypothetical protein